MEDSQKSMHGISFVEVLCVTKGTPNVQRASSNFCNPLLRTTDFIRLKARVTACSSKHKTLLLGKRYDEQAKKSKKNSEPLITSAFTAENQEWFYYDSNQRISDHKCCHMAGQLQSSRSVCSLNH